MSNICCVRVRYKLSVLHKENSRFTSLSADGSRAGVREDAKTTLFVVSLDDGGISDHMVDYSEFDRLVTAWTACEAVDLWFDHIRSYIKEREVKFLPSASVTVYRFPSPGNQPATHRWPDRPDLARFPLNYFQ